MSDHINHSAAEEKRRLRREMRAVLSGVPAETRDHAARLMEEAVVQLCGAQGARRVLAYQSVGHELDTTRALARLVNMGIEVWTTPPSAGAHPAGPYLRWLPQGASSGADATQEPFDAIWVPGLAWDQDGYRLGQGGGYYDRLLSLHPGVWTFSAALPTQMVHRLPREPHDIPVRNVITLPLHSPLNPPRATE